MRVVIVGGGVLGLMTARELAMSGVSVTIMDRGALGMESSWAGGGIVSPLYPWRYPPAVTALASLAQDMYPQLAEQLLADTGIDPEYYPCGMLMLDAEDRRDALAWASRNRTGMEVLAEDALGCLGEGLDRFCEGLWLPHIANVRNPRLLTALAADVRRRGVTVHEQCELRGWDKSGGRITAAVSGSGERFEADMYVVAAGAWTGALCDGVTAYSPPVRPVKGQMLLYRDPQRRLSQIRLHRGHYVIPRRDGHVLCGSTLEFTGFDKSTTTSAREALREVAEMLAPWLRGNEPVAHWAGLRPGSPNGIPYIGRVPELENLWVNAGQFRNGLVLAPASSRLLAELIGARAPCVDPAPYGLG